VGHVRLLYPQVGVIGPILSLTGQVCITPQNHFTELAELVQSLSLGGLLLEKKVAKLGTSRLVARDEAQKIAMDVQQK